MKTSKLSFSFPARRVYTACLSGLRDSGVFRAIEGDECKMRISATRGLPIFGENIVINIMAVSSSSCDVELKSSDKLIFNPLIFGNNKRNIADLSQFVRNEVYSRCDRDQIRIASPQIRFKQPK